jgi:tetratricopeptide (TPR) repeat protein
VRTLVILMALTAAAYGQRHKAVEDVDTEKPEGKLLQPALQENDPAKKAVLLEQFAQQFPKFEATPWVLEQAQAIYVKAGDADKTIAVGEKLLALDPDDPEAALQNLKASENKKDLEGVKKWSAMASANARKMVSTPQPKDAEKIDSWKSEVEYAKQVDQYTDYAVYRAASESRDPKVTVELLELLQTRNPKSEYIPKAQSQLFVAYSQAGMNDKALALAEKTLPNDPTNEDMLLLVIDNYSRNKKEPEKVHAYSEKLVELMATKPAPAGVADAAWTARRSQVTGLAHYMNGTLYYREAKYPATDKELRAALPLVGFNQDIKAEVLYDLGFVNFKMNKAQDAANFYRDCSTLKSQFQATATKNLQEIKAHSPGIK